MKIVMGSRTLGVIASLSFIEPVEAIVNFKTNDYLPNYGSVFGDTSDEDRIFNAIQPCGPYFRIAPGLNWTEATLEKLVMVPDVSVKVGLHQGISQTCVKQALQQFENPPTLEEIQAATLAASQAAAQDQHTRLILTGVLVGLFSLTSIIAIAWAVCRSGMDKSIGNSMKNAYATLQAMRPGAPQCDIEAAHLYELTEIEPESPA